MINDHARLLAREVIIAACRMYTTGAGPEDLAKCREAVLNIRWPVRGSGGVAHDNLRTQREVQAAIAEFYSPPTQSDESVPAFLQRQAE